MRRVVLACLVLVIAAAAALGGYLLRRRLAPLPKPLEVIRIERSLPRSDRLNTDDPGALAMSADGRVLVAAVRDGERTALLLQYLDKFDAKTIPGTSGASSPFLSPDGATVGFVASDGRLESVPSGGSDQPMLLQAVPGVAAVPVSGATFGPEGELVAGQRQGGLLRRNAAGQWAALTQPTAWERAHSWPHWTTGTDAVVFTIEYAAPEPSAIAIARLRSPGSHVVVAPGRRAWFVDPTHLVVAREDGLWRVDVRDGTAAKATKIAAEVGAAANGSPIAAIGGGHLVYAPAAGVALISASLSRPGMTSYFLPERRQFSLPRLSPDGKAVAVVEAAGPRLFSLSIYDASSGARLATAAMTVAAPPLWTDDSRWVLYPEQDGDGWRLSWLSVEAREGVGRVLTQSSGSDDGRGTRTVRLLAPGVDAQWSIAKANGGDVCVGVTTARRIAAQRLPAALAAGVAADDGCGNANYDVSADGSRLVAVYREPVARPSSLRFVLNFASELRSPP